MAENDPPRENIKNQKSRKARNLKKKIRSYLKNSEIILKNSEIILKITKLFKKFRNYYIVPFVIIGTLRLKFMFFPY